MVQTVFERLSDKELLQDYDYQLVAIRTTQRLKAQSGFSTWNGMLVKQEQTRDHLKDEIERRGL